MKAAPAFQFYAADFATATRDWSAAEVGAYIRLLCHEWDTGPLPSDETRLARIVGSDIEEFRALWRTVRQKFGPGGPGGGLVNERLEQIRHEQQARRRARSAAAKAGADARWGEPSATRPRLVHDA